MNQGDKRVIKTESRHGVPVTYTLRSMVSIVQEVTGLAPLYLGPMESEEAAVQFLLDCGYTVLSDELIPAEAGWDDLDEG